MRVLGHKKSSAYTIFHFFLNTTLISCKINFWGSDVRKKTQNLQMSTKILILLIVTVSWRQKSNQNKVIADVSHGLTGQGRPVELLGGGMPRTSGDEDGNAVPFSALSFPGHRGHFGWGKPSPPTVPSMRYAGPLTYTERKVPFHRTVRQGSGAKWAAVSGGVV